MATYKKVLHTGSNISELTNDSNYITSVGSISYNDLTDKPTIPTNNNQLTNGAGYLTSSNIINWARYNVVADTRSTLIAPYSGGKLVRWDFKGNSTDGLNDGSVYHGVLQFNPWGDDSGGKSHQMGFTYNNNIYVRVNSNRTTWGSWSRLAHASEIPSLSGYATQSWVNSQGFLKSETDSQTLSISGSSLSISGGNSVTLPFFDGDYNSLRNRPTIPSLSGYATQSWVNSQGFLTSQTDSQQLSISGRTISLTNSSSVVVPASFNGTNNTSGSAGSVAKVSDYSWSASTTPRNTPQGLTLSFVRSTDGFPQYGSVVNIRTYSSSDGGIGQVYFPYDSNYGGDAMRYRLGKYSGGWTSWKTVADRDWVGSQGYHQDLSISGKTLTISSGNSITLPTDNNHLSSVRQTGADSTPAGTQFNNAFVAPSGSTRSVYFDGGAGRSSVSTWYGVQNKPYAAIDVSQTYLSVWTNNTAGAWKRMFDVYGDHSLVRANVNFQSTGVITASGGDSTSWNAAYGWGDHKLAGYSKFSGSYNDLSNKPTIPTNTNQLTNGAGFLTSLPSHNHDDRYYTKSAVEGLVNAKASLSGASFTGHVDVGSSTPFLYVGDGTANNDGSWDSNIMLDSHTHSRFRIENRGNNKNLEIYSHSGTSEPHVRATDSSTKLYVGVSGREGYFDNSGHLTIGGHYYDSSNQKVATENHVSANYLTTSGKAADSHKLDGLAIHSGVNNQANRIVRTDGNGYAHFGWINTTSGALTTQTINRIFCSGDQYIRYMTPANFGKQIASHIDYSSLANKPSLFSGSYNDLSNKPTIPTNNNQLTNGAGYVTSSVVSGYATQSWVNSQGFLKSDRDTQDLSISGRTISLTDGGSVTVPATDISGKANLSGATFTGNIRTSTINNYANLMGHSGGLEVQSSANGYAGIFLSDTNGNYMMQMYASSSAGSYGFLDAEWNAWDIRKLPRGRFHMNNDTTYYLQLESNSYVNTLYANQYISYGNIQMYSNNTFLKGTHSNGSTRVNLIGMKTDNWIQLGQSGYGFVSGTGGFSIDGADNVYAPKFQVSSSNNSTHWIAAYNLVTGQSTNTSATVQQNWHSFNSGYGVRFKDNDSSHYVSLTAPANLTSNVTLKLPTSTGSSKQVLTTDGSGNSYWATPVDNDTRYSAGTGMSLSGTTFNCTVVNTDTVTTNIAGTGVSVSSGTGNSTISIGQAVATSSDVRFDSFGVGTNASGTTGEIRATGDVTAFYSSDMRLKNNVIPIQAALEKINQVGGYEFDWKEDKKVHSHKGHDVGVIAQEIEEVCPEVVTTRDNGYKAVNYEKLVPLLIQSIKELSNKVDELGCKCKCQ